jgi:hypothetical protein
MSRKRSNVVVCAEVAIMQGKFSGWRVSDRKQRLLLSRMPRPFSLNHMHVAISRYNYQQHGRKVFGKPLGSSSSAQDQK